LLFGLFLLSLTACHGQPALTDYLGAWSGELPATDAFTFDLTLKKEADSTFHLSFKGKQKQLTLPFKAMPAGQFLLKYGEQLSVHLYEGGQHPTAFIETGNHLTYLDFRGNGPEWTARWNLFTAKQFDPSFYLSLNEQADGSIYASTFFQSPVMHYMLGQDFKSAGQHFSFRDIRSGLKFTGVLGEKQIELTMAFLLEELTIAMYPTEYSTWRIGQPDPGAVPHLVRQEDKRFDQLTQDILSDTLEQTHAVLIQQNGKNIYEHYFDGFDEKVTHDTRSVAKSFASAILGAAIADGYFTNEDQPIKPFFEKEYPDTDWGNAKEKITLRHLLTMSSGLDAIDFGL
ncbi:MAG: serine hydrolase, partial [Bacteroidota bacterium]